VQEGYGIGMGGVILLNCGFIGRTLGIKATWKEGQAAEFGGILRLLEYYAFSIAQYPTDDTISVAQLAYNEGHHSPTPCQAGGWAWHRLFFRPCPVILLVVFASSAKSHAVRSLKMHPV